MPCCSAIKFLTPLPYVNSIKYTQEASCSKLCMSKKQAGMISVPQFPFRISCFMSSHRYLPTLPVWLTTLLLKRSATSRIWCFLFSFLFGKRIKDALPSTPLDLTIFLCLYTVPICKYLSRCTFSVRVYLGRTITFQSHSLKVNVSACTHKRFVGGRCLTIFR